LSEVNSLMVDRELCTAEIDFANYRLKLTEQLKRLAGVIRG
jgi:hypothetical protein